jgi:integrase
MLGNTNAPLDVQRDLMRHSSIVTTIDTYGDTVPETVRAVNSQVVKLVLYGPQLDPR